jgi:hypothetical protein
MRNWGFGLVCELEYGYGISTFVSESFELQLEHIWESMGHAGLSYVQIPSVVLEIRFRPMFTMSGL